MGCCCTIGDREVVDEPSTNQSITNHNETNYCLHSKVSVLCTSVTM